MNEDDKEYSDIVDCIEWDDPRKYIERLRVLVNKNHEDSMNLLAIVLGDIDSIKYRDEIIRLYEESYRLGSQVAAKGLSIQYRQWNEIEKSRIWEFRARGRGIK